MSAITLIVLVFMVSIPAISNIFAYPVSKKISMFISNYISGVLAPRLFSILRCYMHFYFWGYNETKSLLPKNYIIISNHQSLFDIPVFMKFLHERQVRFVAKDTLGRHVPLVSEMLRTQQHCLIPRNAKPMEAMKVVEDFGKRVADRNQVPILFPEGHRTRDGNVGTFYSAGFRKLVESSNLPVAVCALDGGYELRDLSMIFRKLRHGCYRVKVLKVYDCPKDKDEAQKILEESKVLIQTQLEEWRKLPSTEY